MLQKSPVTFEERKPVVIVAAITLLLTSLPYLLGYALTPPDMEFGGLVMNIEDSQNYLAKMLQGAQGRWLCHIPFTPEEHDGAFTRGATSSAGGWHEKDRLF